MRGDKFDVMGGYPSMAAQGQGPSNRFVGDPLLLNPLIGAAMGVNEKERMVSQRNVPFKLAVQMQPQQVTVQGDGKKSFVSPGIVVLPDAGLWQGVK